MKRNHHHSTTHKSTDILSNKIINVKEFTALDIESANFEWLIPNFLSKQSLNMVYAGAGAGKSMFAIHLCNYLVKNNVNLDEIVYMDADNGIDILQSRQVDKIMDNSNGKIKYILSNSSHRFTIFKKLNREFKAGEIKNRLIIIDSIRNFIKGSLSKDDNITRFMADLQGLRDKGATIIFLHHQPKQGMDKNDENYKGATAFMDSVDEAYYLQNESDSSISINDNEMIVSLKPKKKRSHTKEMVALIDTRELDLKFIEDDFIGLSDKEKISLQLAQEIIDQKGEICQSDLAIAIQKLANKNYYETVGRNTLWKLFDKFDGKLFDIKRLRGYQNCNKKVFVSRIMNKTPKSEQVNFDVHKIEVSTNDFEGAKVVNSNQLSINKSNLKFLTAIPVNIEPISNVDQHGYSTIRASVGSYCVDIEIINNDLDPLVNELKQCIKDYDKENSYPTFFGGDELLNILLKIKTINELKIVLRSDG